jgi:hypothetical protein
MSTEIQCPSCHKRNRENSVFCRHCGQRIPKADGDRQMIVNRTADFSDLQGALNAIGDYFAQWPDGPEARDVDFTRNCIRLLLNLAGLGQGKFLGIYEDISRLAEVVDQGLPTYLANGLATSARVQDKEKRDEILTALIAYHDACAHTLYQLYEAAEKESQSLFVDGKSQAQIKQVTMEDAYRDAEVHYASYEKGDLDAARRGFTYLKELSPHDAYFRNVLGAILMDQGKPLPALQEYIFGLSLDPGEVHLTANTLQSLCGLAMFPAAVEVARHYERVGGDSEEPTIRPWISLARALTAAVAVKMAQCTPKDLSPAAADLIDEFEPPQRPWLTEPKSFADFKSLLHNVRVFISYRHAGGIDYAERLERVLKGAYPSMRVFRDQTLLVAGQDFVDQLREEIDEADVFLALIDQNWAGGTGKKSRLHDRKDFVRREVARALEKKVLVIPILLEGAQMPRQSDLPNELKELSQLHALGLTEAGFDSDFGLLQSTMNRLLKTKKMGDLAIERELEELEELEARDPVAYEKEMDRSFKPAIEELPKYVPGESTHGEGVPLSSVELEGIWECIVMGSGGQVTLRFTTEGTTGTPFLGEIRAKEGVVCLWNPHPEEIRGTWMPMIDFDKGLLLGLFLDGLKSGVPFTLFVPFHRRLGNDLVGTDSEGVTYCSRNVEPRRKGF